MEDNLSYENGQQEYQPLQQKVNLLSYIKENKLLVFFFVGVFLLLLIIIISIIINVTFNPKGNQTTIPTPTLVQNNTRPSTNQTETVIKEEVQTQLTKTISVPYTISKVKTYDENSWALIKVNNKDAGNAVVVVKNENNTWKVVSGPGTYFDPEELQQLGAPQSIINEINGSFYAN